MESKKSTFLEGGFFTSHSVIVGFTAGAALLISTGQLKYAMGIHIPNGSSFLSSWSVIIASTSEINGYELSIALTTLICGGILKTWRPHWPGLLIAMIMGSLLAILLQDDSHGIRFLGSLPGNLPPLSRPDLNLDTLRLLAPGALAVALLGLIEASSIARSITMHSKQHIDGNQEFIGQGLSNIVGSFFSGYASSGSFTRSGINYESGAMVLVQEAERRKTLNKEMFLCRLNREVYHFLEKGNYLLEIGENHIFDSKQVAISAIVSRLNKAICDECPHRIFSNCPSHGTQDK